MKNNLWWSNLISILKLIVTVSLIAESSNCVLAAESSSSMKAEGASNREVVIQALDSQVKWKLYPTALTNWNASVSYVTASGPVGGLVAPCGESGQVTYVSRNKPSNNIRISRINLRTGSSLEYELPKLNLIIVHKVSPNNMSKENYNNRDLKWLSCSPDGLRIALTFERNLGKYFQVQKSFIVELKTLKVIPLVEFIVNRQIVVAGRPVSPSFSLILGGNAAADKAKAREAGMNILPIENIVDAVKKLHGVESIANVFLQDVSASIIVTSKREKNQSEVMKKISFIQVEGEQFSDVKKCSVNGFQLRYAQAASSGLIVTVSQIGEMNKSRPYYLKQGNRDNGICDFEPFDEWSQRQEPESLGYVDDTPGYAGDFAFWVSTSFKLPKAMVDKFDVNFYLSTDQASPIFSSQIVFKGVGTIDEQPLVWMPISLPSKDQFTFVYGPHGTSTAFVHIWSIK